MRFDVLVGRIRTIVSALQVCEWKEPMLIPFELEIQILLTVGLIIRTSSKTLLFDLVCNAEVIVRKGRLSASDTYSINPRLKVKDRPVTLAERTAPDSIFLLVNAQRYRSSGLELISSSWTF